MVKSATAGAKEGNICYCGDHARIFFSPEIYPLKVMFHAAYALLDRAYIYFEGDAKKQLVVNIMPKGRKPGQPARPEELKKLAMDFNEQVVSSSNFMAQLERTAGLREILLKKALLDENGG